MFHDFFFKKIEIIGSLSPVVGQSEAALMSSTMQSLHPNMTAQIHVIFEI